VALLLGALSGRAPTAPSSIQRRQRRARCVVCRSEAVEENVYHAVFGPSNVHVVSFSRQRGDVLLVSQFMVVGRSVFESDRFSSAIATFGQRIRRCEKWMFSSWLSAMLTLPRWAGKERQKRTFQP